jgi:alpha-L-fucosidase
MITKIWIFLSGLVFVGAGSSGQNNVAILPTDSPADILRRAAHVVPSPRQLRWQRLELTAFFHFGINTFTDREWGDGKEDLSLFNPSQLDARQWVRVAKQAGIRQVILTAKHHDGFCLWPSKYTDHTIAHTPYKNGHGDIVKEFADACHEYGMGMGLYLSPWDRHSPAYGDSAKYNMLFLHWLTELLTQYGRVDEVWFDGANGEGPNGKKQVYAYEAWFHLIRRLQPQAVIAIMGPDVRWVGTETGQGRLTEWSVLPLNARQEESIAANSQKDQTFAPLGDLMDQDLGSREQLMKAKGLMWYPAETDVSIRPGWFNHAREDSLVRSPSGLMDLYFTSVGRNSVLLLNIPPNRKGLISDADIRSLQGWRRRMDSTFGVDLAVRALQRDSGMTTEIKFVGDDGEYAKTFDVLLLQEDIRQGQRVEQFVFEAEEHGDWVQVASGTTIGYKRLLRFPPVTASRVRLRILSSRLNPVIANIGLYKLAE